MKLRARSRSRQWKRWIAAALVALVAYLLLSALFYGTVTLNVLQPRAHRLALPIFLVFACVAWELRWDGVTRKKSKAHPVDANFCSRRNEVDMCSEGRDQKIASTVGCDQKIASTWGRDQKIASTGDRDQKIASAGGRDQKIASAGGRDQKIASTGDEETGEALYARARAIPHLPIPDFLHDGTYLNLLGRSAAKGHAPALAKLGAYAMRRAAWVEAYYWITRAQRCGEPDCDSLLHSIRQSWKIAGFPDETGNVSELFPEEAGSIGRALLHVDSGYRSVQAREYLTTHHPEYLVQGDRRTGSPSALSHSPKSDTMEASEKRDAFSAGGCLRAEEAI